MTVDAVLDAVHAHAAGTSQSDDITVLALRRLPVQKGVWSTLYTLRSRRV